MPECIQEIAHEGVISPGFRRTVIHDALLEVLIQRLFIAYGNGVGAFDFSNDGRHPRLAEGLKDRFRGEIGLAIFLWEQQIETVMELVKKRVVFSQKSPWRFLDRDSGSDE